MATPDSLNELPEVVDIADQPCQRLYERNPVLLGFDVVQYHFIPSYRDGGVAVRGSPEYAYNFEGYQFWFSTEKNRNLFINDPWKYAPAWGGFCSWGIARELPPQWPWQVDFLGPPASPWEGWLIQDNKLIFNIWADYSDRFLEEADSNMVKAEERWSEWFGSLEAGPFNTHCIGHGSLQNWCMAQQPSPWMESLPKCTVTATTNSSPTDAPVSTVAQNTASPTLPPTSSPPTATPTVSTNSPTTDNFSVIGTIHIPADNSTSPPASDTGDNSFSSGNSSDTIYIPADNSTSPPASDTGNNSVHSGNSSGTIPADNNSSDTGDNIFPSDTGDGDSSGISAPTSGDGTDEDCSEIIASGGILHENCSDVTVQGGGVVSSAGEYEDFANARYTPHQQKIIKVVASLGFIFVLFVLLLILFRKRVRAVCCKSKEGDALPYKAHEDDESCESSSSPSQEETESSAAAVAEGDVAVPVVDGP